MKELERIKNEIKEEYAKEMSDNWHEMLKTVNELDSAFVAYHIYLDNLTESLNISKEMIILILKKLDIYPELSAMYETNQTIEWGEVAKNYSLKRIQDSIKDLQKKIRDML